MRHRRALPAKAAICAIITIGIIIAAIGASSLVWPSAPGDDVKKKNGMTVDVSNSDDGYVMGKYTQSQKRLKFRLTLADDSYTYDLNGDGDYEVFPLQMGNGKYNAKVFKQASGNRYTQEASQNFNVKLSSDDAPFLCPNQYIWYTQESPAVAMSNELCEGLQTDAEKLEAIRSYVRSNFSYNYMRAMTVTSGYLPDLDCVYEEKSGICFDIAGITACMLRVQGVAAKMAIGYANTSYHAWNEVLIDGEYILVDITSEITAANVTSYAVERVY
ncbi:MAG: transglutaminase-like domain-containing protein [Clostridia bacterium]|nr:transglutaminase-like domain-containing protein [Clostridia bacterium]